MDHVESCSSVLNRLGQRLWGRFLPWRTRNTRGVPASLSGILGLSFTKPEDLEESYVK